MNKFNLYTANQYNWGRISLLFFFLLSVTFGFVSLGLMFSHRVEAIWVMLTATGVSLLACGYYADQYTIVQDSLKAIEKFKEKQWYEELQKEVSALKRPLTYEEMRHLSCLE